MKRKLDDLSAPDVTWGTPSEEDSWDDVECKVKLTMTLASETLAEIAHLRRKKEMGGIDREIVQERITAARIADQVRVTEVAIQLDKLENLMSDTRRWLADLTHHLQDKDPLTPCKCDSHVLKPYW